MIPEAPSEDVNAYCTIAKIKQSHIPISRGSLLNAALSASLVAALQVLLDSRGQESVYMHCLDGRRITGLLVLLVRRLQNWAPGAAFAEYWRYQTAMRPPVSVFEMARVSKETVKFILDTAALVRLSREHELPRWLTLAAMSPSDLSIDPSSSGAGGNSGPNSATLSGNATPSSTYQKAQNQASTSGRTRTTSGGVLPKRTLISIGDDDDDDDDRIIGMQRHLQISTSNTSLLSFKGSPQAGQMRRSSSLDFLQGDSESESPVDKNIREGSYTPSQSGINYNSNFNSKDANDDGAVGTRAKMSTKSVSGGSSKPPLPPPLVRTRSVVPSAGAASAQESGISSSLDALALHGMDLKFQKK